MKKALLTLLFSANVISCSAELKSNDYLFFSPEMISSHMKTYTDEEKVAIDKDLAVVRSVSFSREQPPKKRPVYISTAGSPGSRKTTILERFLYENRHNPSIFQPVYLDPDQRGLKFMAHTYYSRSLCALALGEDLDFEISQKKAYEKWRGASNYIALTLVEEAFRQQRDIAYGATSTGEHMASFLTQVRNAGYSPIFLLCSCEDAFVQQAIEYRNHNQKFYQSTPEDALSKRKLFPQRMSVYFTYADELYLYWSDELFQKERLAGVLKNGQLEIRDADAYARFSQRYEKDRSLLAAEGKSIPSWNELLSLHCRDRN